MDFASVSSPEAAFIAGLVTSLHCAGMCGPLACSVMPVKREQGDLPTAATAQALRFRGRMWPVSGAQGPQRVKKFQQRRTRYDLLRMSREQSSNWGQA